MLSIFPCATGERTTRMAHCSAKLISAANRPSPLSSGRSSSRGTERPIYFSPLIAASLAHLFCCRAHRLDDVLVAGAAAEVGREHVQQIVVGHVGLALQHTDGEHQKTRRAEAALQSVIVHEGLLHRMQRIAVC